ncbi:MAG: response regulator transcription factor [Isosphaeraceae bacterium]
MKQRLLIADGDTVLCEVYRGFLTERGYEVETSTDGLDCLAKLRQATPAVLVLDLELLWGGGDGVLAWLREESRAPRVPVLLTATAADPADVAGFNEPPVVDYLPKPFALAGLLESIRSAVATKGRRGPSNLDRVPGYLSLLDERVRG